MSRLFAIAGLLAVAFLSAEAQLTCFAPGRCHGFLLGITESVDGVDCLQSCQNEVAGCEWFTYDDAFGVCELFETCDLDEADCADNCVSGEAACQVCDLDGLCQGNLIEEAITSSHFVCKEVCRNNFNCEFYTFESSSGACFQFETCSALTICDTCISGQQSCDVEFDPNGVALVGGANRTEGNVVVAIEGRGIGEVCDDGWSTTDAGVLCRQLGFSTAVSAPCCSSYGTGQDNYLMDDVACTGTEDRLQDCSHLTTDNCGTTEWAGAVCA